MDLIPVRTVFLAADRPPDALAELLRTVIGTGPPTPFTGSVEADGFVITRMNEFRSLSVPLVRGRCTAMPGGGTGVRLRLRPPGIVIIFMAVWLGFLAAVAALIIGAHARHPGRSLLPLLAPAGLAALSWAVLVSVSAAEERWALQRLLEAIPVLRPSGAREFRN